MEKGKVKELSGPQGAFACKKGGTHKSLDLSPFSLCLTPQTCEGEGERTAVERTSHRRILMELFLCTQSGTDIANHNAKTEMPEVYLQKVTGCGMLENRPCIQKATPEDVPVLYRLINELADYENLSHAVAAREADIRGALFGTSAVLNALVARVGPEVAGFATYYWTFSTFRGKTGLYIEDLFVRTSARGQGVGRALMEALAVEAVDRGCGHMSWSVLGWNRTAIDFYRSLGASPVSEWLTFRIADDPLSVLADKNSGAHNPAGN